MVPYVSNLEPSPTDVSRGLAGIGKGRGTGYDSDHFISTSERRT